MSECIFCKIISGDVAGQIVGENEQARAFLDVNPVSKGHTLVVPKRHAETTLDLSSDELHALFDLVNEATRKIKQALQPDGFNIGLNMHEAAGQVVEHVHVHIIPRWLGDGGGNMHSIIHNPPSETLDQVLAQINEIGV